MTPAEHAALSAELARALGAEGNRVPNGGVWVLDPPLPLGKRTLFDYRSPDVCLPLIEWLYTECGAAIERESGHFWVSVRPIRTMRAIASGNTLPEAVARAVIAIRARGKVPTWTAEQVSHVNTEADRLADKLSLKMEGVR